MLFYHQMRMQPSVESGIMKVQGIFDEGMSCMFKKKRLLGTIIPVAVVLLVIIINQSRTFTYDAFIQDHLDEGDEIVYVRITTDMYMQNKRFTTKIEDRAIIEKLTQIPYMELKRSFTSSTPSPTEYPHGIHIQGKSSSFSFVFNDAGIHKDRTYKAEDLNDLLYIIKQADLGWELH